MWVDQLNQALAERYRIQRELGHNGFRVYLAHDLKHHREVALWVTRPEGLAAMGRAERFLREIVLTAQLDHPYILPILDSGQAHGFLYYVMPHGRGMSLRDRLSREKQLPLSDALQITRQVAEALCYAHGRGFLHGDVKPENILLATGHARLAGWNTRALRVAAGETPGLVIGTPDYMSPEWAAGAPDLDHRSDVYSLACVFYEMLTGHPPFVASNIQTLLAKVVAEIPTPIRYLRPDIPPPIESALGRALAKRPADRFATALQFTEALEPPAAAPMTPELQLKCPLCRSALQRTQTASLTIHFCQSCTGLWLDYADLQILTRRRGLTAERKTPAPRRSATHFCPRCEIGLVQEPWGKAMLFRCDRCRGLHMPYGERIKLLPLPGDARRFLRPRRGESAGHEEEPVGDFLGALADLLDAFS
ncbi:MAG TPA: protein kinase [Gemmatimonadales bacterium]|nr:protein kinase [Gemmatimonadales bacterium]